MAIAAGGSGSTRPSSRAATSIGRGRVPLPHAVGRRSTTPATTRPASTTRSSSSRYEERARGAARRARGRSARRRRARLRRRAVDLEHGLHHARADGRASARPACRSRGTPRAATVAISPLGGITVRIGDDAAGPGARDGLRAGRRRRARRRARGRRGADRGGHVDERLDGRVRQLLVALLRASARAPSHLAAQKLAAKIAAIRDAPRRRDRCRCAASPGSRTGTPRRCRRGWSPGLARDRLLRRAQPRSRRTTRTASRPRPRTASSPTSRSSRSTATTGRGRRSSTTSTVHDAGRLLNPLLADGQVRGGFAHGVGAALFERARLRRGRATC